MSREAPGKGVDLKLNLESNRRGWMVKISAISRARRSSRREAFEEAGGVDLFVKYMDDENASSS